MEIDFTTIITALLACTAITAPLGAWLSSRLTRQKYQAEVDQLKADVNEALAQSRSVELDNVRKANEMLMETVVTPLKKEISGLRRDVKKFSDAVKEIPTCKLAECCPVSKKLKEEEDPLPSSPRGGEKP